MARILGMVLDGIQGVEVTLEARYSASLRSHEIKVVGLPEASVKEGMHRARSAAHSLVHAVVNTLAHGVLVNLAPADVRKTGRSLDLPLTMVYAALLLGASDESQGGLVFVGEVGLSGAVRAVPGVLSAVLSARTAGRYGLVLPKDNLDEARLIDGPRIYAVESVADAFAVLLGKGVVDAGPRGPRPRVELSEGLDLSEVCGQFSARRALEIAAAGGHNLLFEGPPGSGKTMLAKRLTSILPGLTDQQALEVAVVHSAVRAFDPKNIHRPPWRAPHHTATPAGLGGGGQPLRPGELSLAHHGVLFLDEFPEFDRRALEILREPMEERCVHLVRAGAACRFPADFLCVAAMNPCPCGYFDQGDGRCRCTPRQVQSYRSRISGPLLDRFDLRMALRAVPAEALFGTQGGHGESSADVRARVLVARGRQSDRYRDSAMTNAKVSDSKIRSFANYGPKERAYLLRVLTAHRLSARATRRLERVARTIADLAMEDRVTEIHLTEALAYRLGNDLERKAKS